jgi:hypothetical protein
MSVRTTFAGLSGVGQSRGGHDVVCGESVEYLTQPLEHLRLLLWFECDLSLGAIVYHELNPSVWPHTVGHRAVEPHLALNVRQNVALTGKCPARFQIANHDVPGLALNQVRLSR